MLRLITSHRKVFQDGGLNQNQLQKSNTYYSESGREVRDACGREERTNYSPTAAAKNDAYVR